jgi:DNA modification methylase
MAPWWEIRQGDVIERLKEMTGESVHCVVTSPPYFSQRDYGIEGQIGLERTVDEYVAKMVAVFAEIRRVLRNDGTCWLVIGDTYVGSWQNYGGGARGAGNQRPITKGSIAQNPVWNGLENWRPPASYPQPGLKPKDLMMVPARVALALQASGWWLRSEITWVKPAPMPESVLDRPTSATEKIFLLTKDRRYFYDIDAERVAYAESSVQFQQQTLWQQDDVVIETKEKREITRGQGYGAARAGPDGYPDRDGGFDRPDGGRNLWNWWLIGPEPLSLPHYAAFPSELPRRCISLGTSAKGVCPICGAPWKRQGTNWKSACTHDGEPEPALVLDPFSGAGTTGLAALRLGRNYLGIELNPEYVEMSRRRIRDDAPLLNVAAEMIR